MLTADSNQRQPSRLIELAWAFSCNSASNPSSVDLIRWVPSPAKPPSLELLTIQDPSFRSVVSMSEAHNTTDLPAGQSSAAALPADPPAPPAPAEPPVAAPEAQTNGVAAAEPSK